MESKQKKLKVAVIGSSTMGTALSHLIASADHDCALLTDDPQVVEAVNKEHRHPHFFNGLHLHPHVEAHLQWESALSNADLLVMAVASYEMREVAQAIAAQTHSEHLGVKTRLIINSLFKQFGFFPIPFFHRLHGC